MVFSQQQNDRTYAAPRRDHSQRYFTFFLLFVFSLPARKNEQQVNLSASSASNPASSASNLNSSAFVCVRPRPISPQEQHMPEQPDLDPHAILAAIGFSGAAEATPVAG